MDHQPHLRRYGGIRGLNNPGARYPMVIYQSLVNTFVKPGTPPSGRPGTRRSSAERTLASLAATQATGRGPGTRLQRPPRHGPELQSVVHPVTTSRVLWSHPAAEPAGSFHSFTSPTCRLTPPNPALSPLNRRLPPKRPRGQRPGRLVSRSSSASLETPSIVQLRRMICDQDSR